MCVRGSTSKVECKLRIMSVGVMYARVCQECRASVKVSVKLNKSAGKTRVFVCCERACVIASYEV